MDSLPIEDELENRFYENATKHLKEVMHHLVTKPGVTYEERLQLRLFYIDHTYAVQYGEPYTDARYYAHGAHILSPEIRYILLEQLDLKKRKHRPSPEKPLRYQYRAKPKHWDFDYEHYDPDLINEKQDEFKDMSIEDLKEYTKATAAYRAVDHGHQISLENADPVSPAVTGGRKRGPEPHLSN